MISLGERIGSGNTGDVYAVQGSPGRVVKLITKETHSVEKEFAVSKIVGELGCGAPRAYRMVRVGGLDGIEYDRVEGRPWIERLIRHPEEAPQMALRMAGIHHRIHSFAPDGLARKYESDRPGALCHGDFHPGNIMGGYEAPLVIDWNDAYAGDPSSDVCRTLLLLAGVGNSPEPDAAHGEARHGIFGFGALYLREYLRLSGMDARDIFAWQRMLAKQRLAEGVPGLDGFLTRVAEGGRMFPWDLRVKRKKFARGMDNPAVKEARYEQKHVRYGDFSGSAGLLHISEAHESLAMMEYVILDTGYRLLYLMPDDGGYVLAAFIDEKGSIACWYVDLIGAHGVDGDGSIWFDDVFLDIILSPDGNYIIDDRDELEAAHALGVITGAQYRATLDGAEKLLRTVLSDPKRLTDLCMRIVSAFDSDETA